MYCRKCGKEIDDNAMTCPYCGTATQGPYRGNDPFGRDEDSFGRDVPPEQNGQNGQNGGYFYSPRQTAPDDAPSMGWGVLGFFIPIAGLVLYLVWRDQYPLRAKSCGKGALASVIVNVVFVILYVILMLTIASSVSARSVFEAALFAMT